MAVIGVSDMKLPKSVRLLEDDGSVSNGRGGAAGSFHRMAQTPPTVETCRMGISRIAAVAFGAAVLAGSASLALAQRAPSGAYQQQTGRPSGHGGHSHFLTPEQHAMWHQEHRTEIKAMSPEERHAYRQQFRQQLLAMTPAQKAQLRDQLQAQWNQLPQQRQQAIEQRIAQRQQNGHGQQGHQHGGGAYPSYPSQGAGNPGTYNN
jgi:hypothetical protein